MLSSTNDDRTYPTLGVGKWMIKPNVMWLRVDLNSSTNEFNTKLHFFGRDRWNVCLSQAVIISSGSSCRVRGEKEKEKSKECECVTMKMTSNYHLAPLSVHTVSVWQINSSFDLPQPVCHTTPGHWIIALFAWAKAPKSLRAILKIDIRYFFISFFLPSRHRSYSVSVRFSVSEESLWTHDRHHRTHYWPLSRSGEIK